MYLHICLDDKFLDYFIANVGSIDPAENHYWANLRTGASEFIYIKSEAVESFRTSEELVAKYKEKYEGKIKTIFIHFLTDIAISFLGKINTKGLAVVWFFWGADGYRFSKLSGNLYLSETSAYLGEKTVNRSPLRQFLSTLRFDFRFRKALQKINYCASWVKGDYDLICKYNNNLRFLFFSYYSVEQIVGKELYAMTLKKHTETPGSVLVGNSAFPTNNHLDTFLLLKENEWTGKVICPLSYGDSESYKKDIIRKGYEFFGSRFQPIENFMDKDSYNKILADVDLVLMNQTRQQAGGNTLTSIWLGKKVFFNKNSTLFKTFRDLGLAVFTTEQFQTEGKTALEDTVIESNRNILEKYMGNESIKNAYLKLYEI